jgi:hypothetical protein
VADPNVERPLAGHFRDMTKRVAGLEIIIDCRAESLAQLSNGFALVGNQGPDELQLAKQAVVFGAGFDRTVVTPVL